jgi:2-polyprenyl-3-methyl-5-hydroxy-6-metoxy-1,4-benzoquinol methylase
MQQPFTRHPSSYRDPSGFLFYQNDVLYRQVSQFFKNDFDLFISSGLYAHLVKNKTLIPHEQVNENLTGSADWYQTIKPQALSFVSYPYEWCFDMLKDAALLTLQVAEEAMQFGMMLKDASAYNVQWHKGKMVFIDTLSFEKYDAEKPWIAYRQFCEHFLAPLALMHYLQMPLQNLMVAYPDGIPLAVTRKLLPFKTKFNLNMFLHVHLQGMVSSRPQKSAGNAQKFTSAKLKNLLRGLKETINSFALSGRSGVWSGYYEEASRREDYLTLKKQIFNEWIHEISYKSAIDLGANEGEFSTLLAGGNKNVISADFDHYSINNLYKKTKKEEIENILPLIIDLSNPSPAIGVNNEERPAFFQRAKTDLVIALALIHHLCVGKNISFEQIAAMFQKTGKLLVIEFVPKEDEKTQIILEQKRDVYHWYTAEEFLTTFSRYFNIIKSKEIGASKRTLYLMQAYES